MATTSSQRLGLHDRRGPSFFFQAEDGIRDIGVTGVQTCALPIFTVHRMDEGFDTGSIVAQAEMPVPAGIAAPDLERDLMTLGGSLLVDALPALAAGDGRRGGGWGERWVSRGRPEILKKKRVRSTW